MCDKKKRGKIRAKKKQGLFLVWRLTLAFKFCNIGARIMPQIDTKTKKRNWAFVVYPESLPQDWLEILQSTGAPIAISPLHDADLNADESEKKPHYHIIICYGGPTSFNVVRKITERVNGTIPIALEQVRGYYRYLTHEDNPEKAQYDKSDIKLLNGFNIADFTELTKSEVMKLKKEILKSIRDNDLTEYSDLIDLLEMEENNRPEALEVATNHTFFFNAYLKSRRFKKNGRG